MSVMLGREKYIQLKHQYLDPVPLRLILLLQSWKSIDHQVVIKFHKNWFKQKVKHYCLWPTNSLTLFGRRKSSLMSGSSLLLYLFMKRAIKLTAVITVGYDCYKHIHEIYSRNKNSWRELLLESYSTIQTYRHTYIHINLAVIMVGYDCYKHIHEIYSRNKNSWRELLLESYSNIQTYIHT
jgi:hypothetical protein